MDCTVSVIIRLSPWDAKHLKGWRMGNLMEWPVLFRWKWYGMVYHSSPYSTVSSIETLFVACFYVTMGSISEKWAVVNIVIKPWIIFTMGPRGSKRVYSWKTSASSTSCTSDDSSSNTNTPEYFATYNSTTEQEATILSVSNHVRFQISATSSERMEVTETAATSQDSHGSAPWRAHISLG